MNIQMHACFFTGVLKKSTYPYFFKIVNISLFFQVWQNCQKKTTVLPSCRIYLPPPSLQNFLVLHYLVKTL